MIQPNQTLRGAAARDDCLGTVEPTPLVDVVSVIRDSPRGG
jgi:hypothetical protein